MVEYMLKDDVGNSIFNTFEKCLSFGDETTRRNALLLFTEAQEMLLRNIDETLDSEKFDDGQEWNEEMLREKAKIREAHIQRYIWSTKLCAYYPRTN
jgi:neutral trehalase